MAHVTDSNRPQPLWQPPPTACLTASEAASALLMQPWSHSPACCEALRTQRTGFRGQATSGSNWRVNPDGGANLPHPAPLPLARAWPRVLLGLLLAHRGVEGHAPRSEAACSGRRDVHWHWCRVAWPQVAADQLFRSVIQIPMNPVPRGPESPLCVPHHVHCQQPQVSPPSLKTNLSCEIICARAPPSPGPDYWGYRNNRRVQDTQKAGFAPWRPVPCRPTLAALPNRLSPDVPPPPPLV